MDFFKRREGPGVCAANIKIPFWWVFLARHPVGRVQKADWLWILGH
jgi:hypothetical protein